MPTPILNQKFILNRRPQGLVTIDDFELVSEPLPSPAENELLVRARYISVDPYMRNRMNNVKSYVEPYELGGVIAGDAIAEVITSRHDAYQPGELVLTTSGWQKYAVVEAGSAYTLTFSDVPSTLYLGLLGITGLTAWFGMLWIGKPQPGQTVVISGAAGAVGQIAGQIAMVNGCKVYGITGSDEKAAFLTTELGFHGVVNYKKTPNLRKALMRLCPDGVDVYFDNVGGEISDSIFYLINDGARIVLCGQIAAYNESRLLTGPRLLSQLIIRRASVQGFIVHDFLKEFDSARKSLYDLYKTGKIRPFETITAGFPNIPQAFIGLFNGDNLGKSIVRV